MKFIAAPPSSGCVPAFAGAEGFGRCAKGGRGGRVVEVTTLAADGPGSLREALDASGARIIVFRVSGEIEEAGPLWIRHGQVTIAGHTSPGGIIVHGLYCDNVYEEDDCNDVIVRHMRSRVTEDGIRLDGANTVVLDHVSLEHYLDALAATR